MTAIAAVNARFCVIALDCYNGRAAAVLSSTASRNPLPTTQFSYIQL